MDRGPVAPVLRLVAGNGEHHTNEYERAMTTQELHVGSREIATWLVAAAAMLGLAVIGEPLLVPLVFALLVWAVFNEAVDALMRLGSPRGLAFTVTTVTLLCAMWMMLTILGNQAADLAGQAPAYGRKLAAIIAEILAPLQLHIKYNDLFSQAQIAGFLGSAATLAAASLFGIIQVLVYVGFLLAEQNQMAHKFARLQHDEARKSESKRVIDAIVHQVQSYLGVCTVLSAIMGAATYSLLTFMGVSFAGLWAVVLFFLTYIPTVGAVGVVLPGLMALVQFGTLWPALIIILVLGLLHFLLLNVAGTVILGQTLNLSPFAIILALTFWGLVWGVSGLFLAVPVTGAIAIVCGHIEKLRWVSVLLAAPPQHRTKSRRKLVGVGEKA
jgi:predicted PurR-regulated permease PerM